jgi:hypothetical protein
MKTITLTSRGVLIAIMGCLLAPSSRAEVHIARFDPPLNVSAFSVPAPGLDWATTAFDFDLDGQPDFRLTYGMGLMTAYFNSPTQFAAKALHPVVVGAQDVVGAVPLGWVIGSNIISSGLTADSYVWSAGGTNNYLPDLLGNHQANVISANQVIPANMPLMTLSNGIWITNISFPPFPVPSWGDVVGQEGVIALQFYIGTELHYGYIHFNFKGGTGGVIYGWAYETEPNVPIKSMQLLTGEKLNKRKMIFDINPVQKHPRGPVPF